MNYDDHKPQRPLAAPVSTEPAATTTPSHTPNKKKKKENSGWHEVLSTIGILATALAVALLIISFVFRSYQVDGPSMETTLQNSDKLIIWKVPRTWAHITGNDYIPKRGDIIVFTQSGLSEYGQTNTKQLIKRVIGVPGDHVTIKDSHFVVTNVHNPNGFDPDEKLGYSKDIPTTTGDVDVTVRTGQVFVAGDNRPDSLDSRSFGPINAEQIVGKLTLRVFPLSGAKGF